MQITELAQEIWEYRCNNPGPIVVVVGGTHGNELTGIEVVKRLRAGIEGGNITLARGVLILALGNLRAIALRERGSTPTANLNACFSKRVICGEDDSYEAGRARELAVAFSAVDVGLDLHATNKPGKPFVVCQRPPTVLDAAVYRRFNVSTVICDPNWIFAGGPETLDEYFASRGGVGICYETGFAKDLSRVEQVRAEVAAIFADCGLTKSVSPPQARRSPAIIYALATAITLTALGFAYAPGLGRYNLQKVAAGQVVGHHGTVPFTAKKDSLIVFPKIKKLWRPGKPVGYLAERIK